MCAMEVRLQLQQLFKINTKSLQSFTPLLITSMTTSVLLKRWSPTLNMFQQYFLQERITNKTFD